MREGAGIVRRRLFGTTLAVAGAVVLAACGPADEPAPPPDDDGVTQGDHGVTDDDDEAVPEGGALSMFDPTGADTPVMADLTFPLTDDDGYEADLEVTIHEPRSVSEDINPVVLTEACGGDELNLADPSRIYHAYLLEVTLTPKTVDGFDWSTDNLARISPSVDSELSDGVSGVLVSSGDGVFGDFSEGIATTTPDAVCVGRKVEMTVQEPGEPSTFLLDIWEADTVGPDNPEGQMGENSRFNHFGVSPVKDRSTVCPPLSTDRIYVEGLYCNVVLKLDE